jgi:hypothetical protein
MAATVRVSPEEIYPRVKSGASLLVCAYDSEETCGSMRLEGSIFLNDLKSRISQVPKDQEIIFYCA